MSKSKDYEIICKIGQGSFGTVYKVKRKSDKQIFVMKMIKVPTLSKKHQLESLQEVTILSSLNNPYIVKYYESFVENSTLHIIMEYCEKGDLSQVIKKQSLTQQKIWKYFVQICIGLEYLHSRQILHRDIKTLNIFLSNDDSVRIGDLGVAKIMNHSAAFAQTQVGSPYYLSPELCEEKPYNNKSDIWALGCVLYEMCTGKHPFTAPNQAALIYKIVQGNYLPIGFEVSGGLKEIVDLCLERDLKRRPTIQSLLMRVDIGSKIDEFGLYVPFGSVLYKQHKSSEFDIYKEIERPSKDGLKVVIKENIRESDKKYSAGKIIEEAQKQIKENKANQDRKSRPLSAIKIDKSRLRSPVKEKAVTPLKVLQKKDTEKDEHVITSVNRSEHIHLHKQKRSLCNVTENDHSQIQPFFAKNSSPAKNEPNVSKTPALKTEKNPEKNSSKLNLKQSAGYFENKQVYKQRVPVSAKLEKLEHSIEDIKLVHNLPEYPIVKQKTFVKYLQESSPVRSLDSSCKQYKILQRPLIEPALREGLGKAGDEDDVTLLRFKEEESVKNEESLRRQCSKLRTDIIEMIGAEKFNEMHLIFTSIITKDEVTLEDQIKIERFVSKNIRGESTKAIYSMYRLLTVETDLAKTEEIIRSIRLGQLMM